MDADRDNGSVRGDSTGGGLKIAGGRWLGRGKEAMREDSRRTVANLSFIGPMYKWPAKSNVCD